MKALRVAWVVLKGLGIFVGWAVTYMALCALMALVVGALGMVAWLTDMVFHFWVVDLAAAFGVFYGGLKFYDRYLWSYFERLSR